MGKPDVSIKQWLRVKNRFADLFNGVLFDGEQIIIADELTEINSESDIIIKDKENRTKTIQRHRDIIMKWQGINLSILAVENQLNVNYAMPVRNMLYDSLSYSDQIHNIWNNVGGDKKRNADINELFSGFRKSDKLCPVITIIFYFGSEKSWDGAISLYDMFEVPRNKKIKSMLKTYVPNYHINILDISNINDVNIFKSDLQIIFGMLKYKNSTDDLLSYTKKHMSYFENIDNETCYAIETLLNSNKAFRTVLNKNKTEGGVNMCKALEDLYLRGEMKGEVKGETKTKISLICRKIVKNKPIDVIADELEEDIAIIKPIYDIVIECGPDYDCDRVYNLLKEAELT